MRAGRIIAAATTCVLLTFAPVLAQDSFLSSKSYKEGQKIVGVFLTDDDYGRMIRGAKHLEGRLDWAWVVGQRNERKIESLGFSTSDYQSIIVQPPVDHTKEQVEGLSERAHEALLVGCKRLGWTPRKQGDLMLATAIVDVFDSDGFGLTKFFNATNKHSVEFEFKLTEAKSGTVLLLARDEAHSANLIGATWRAAAHLTSFLAKPTSPRYQGQGRTVSLDAYEMPEAKKKRKKKKPHQLEKFANPREIAIAAMRNSGIFKEVVAGSDKTDYGLVIRVHNANFVGAYQTTVNVNATYTLTDHGTGKVLMQENVGTSATLSALEVGSGSKRMRQVTPAAFLNNVDAFLLRLDAMLGGSDSAQRRGRK